MNLPSLVFLTILLKSVAPEQYLFRSARISFKVLGKKGVRHKNLGPVTTFDQHYFSRMTDLKINATNMKMYEGAVKNLPNLQVLRMKECGIRILEKKCFQNLPNLQALRLADNDLRSIEEGVFNYLPVMQLWLHRNEITTIRPGAFDNMPRLEEIRLNDNELSEWDGRWFANTPKLWRLFFRQNHIRELPARAFANIKTSHKFPDGVELVDTKILLSKNNISYIHPEAFQGIDSLYELDLKKNRLGKFDWKVFLEFTELHKLSLGKNFLEEVDRDAFRNVKEMEELDLSKNPLECVPFEVVAKAKKVDVSKNPKMKCQCLSNLREKLSEMKIQNEIVAGSDCETN